MLLIFPTEILLLLSGIVEWIVWWVHWCQWVSYLPTFSCALLPESFNWLLHYVIKVGILQADMEFYVKCPQAAYGPSKMSTQVTTIHTVK